jgi:maleate cis-trans isomerase
MDDLPAILAELGLSHARIGVETDNEYFTATARELMRSSERQALFLSCTNMRALEVVEHL